MESETSRRDHLLLVLKLAEFGEMVTDAVQDSMGGLDLADNAGLRVLVGLELYGPSRPGGIAGSIGMTSGGVTKVLTRLEAVGLVSRRYGAFPDDRRGVEVSLTEKGRDVAREFGREFGLQLSKASELVADMSRLLS
jgi:DNA-binding MarR family transcriptional regulator